MRCSIVAVLGALAFGCGSSQVVTICGAGTLRDGTTCIPNPTCANGTRTENGMCVFEGPPAIHCGIGTHRFGSACVPDTAVFTSSTSTTTWGANLRVNEIAIDFATDPAMAVDSHG